MMTKEEALSVLNKNHICPIHNKRMEQVMPHIYECKKCGDSAQAQNEELLREAREVYFGRPR